MVLRQTSIEDLIVPSLQGLSVPQIIFQCAQPWKQEVPNIPREEIAAALQELTARRLYFQGPNGALQQALKQFISPNNKAIREPLETIYPSQDAIFTQLEKVENIISWLGIEHFSQEYLESNFDRSTASTVISCYENIMGRPATEKSSKSHTTGFAEGLLATDIDLDHFIHRSLAQVKNQPTHIFLKYGKTARSLAEKMGFYIADELPFMNRRKGEPHIVDPAMPITYYLFSDKPETDKFIQGYFTVRDSARQEIIDQTLKALKEESTKLENYEKGTQTISRQEKIQAEKKISQYTEQLKRTTKHTIKQLGSNINNQFLEKFYHSIVKSLKDMRGFQAIYNTEENIEEKAGLIAKSPLYVPGSIEIHNSGSTGRTIETIHGKWEPKLFGENEQFEIQLFNKPGILLYELGPYNTHRYHQTKLNTKYKDFTRGQEKLAQNITERAKWLATAIEPSFRTLTDLANARYTTKADFFIAIEEQAHKTYMNLHTIQ